MIETLAVKLEAEEVRSRAFNTIGLAYMGIGTAITKTARMILVQNLTNGKLLFSFDGLTDIFPLPVYGYLLLDVTENKSESHAFTIAVGERLYVKLMNDVLTKGAAYVTVFYANDER